MTMLARAEASATLQLSWEYFWHTEVQVCKCLIKDENSKRHEYQESGLASMNIKKGTDTLAICILTSDLV